MPVKCSVCADPNLAAIDDSLDSGAFQKDVAAQFGVSRYALSRHVRHSAPAPAPAQETEISDLTAEAEKWRVRADQVWEQSVADQDTRGQVQALQAGLRSVELQHRQEQRAAEPKPENGETPVTIEEIDRIVSSELNKTERGKNQNRLFAAPDTALALAVRVLDAPELWGAIETVLEGRL
jgi:hypothetical protein